MIPVGVIAQGGATVPSAPTSFSATPSSFSVSLSWAAPSNNGGLAVTSYTLKRGATTIYTGPDTSFNDTGLSAVTGYSYTVLATNLLGNGPTASISTTTTAGVPSAPVISGSSSGGSTENPAVYYVSWTVPANNGSAITGYVVESYSDYNGYWAYSYSTAGTSGTFYVDIGGDYLIRVYATNAIGSGPPSNAFGIGWYE